MNIQKFYAILLLFVIVSCNSDDYGYIAPEFKQTLDRSVSILNDEFIFSYSTYLTIVDSLLIAAFKTNSTTGYFHIFSKHTGEYLKSFSGIGHGPGELLNGSLSFSTDPVNKKLYVPKESNDSRVVVFDISLAMEREFVPFEEIEANRSPGFMRGDLHFKDDIFLVAHKRESFRYALVNSASDTIATYYTYPVINEVDKNNEMNRIAYYGVNFYVNIKPDRTKLVSTTTTGLLMEIFDISNEKIELLYLWRYIKPSYEIRSGIVFSSGKDKGVGNFQVTDSYIYGIYFDEEDRSSNNIWVFDWEGVPVKRYQLDKNVYRIAIDEEAGFAYVQIHNDEPSIGRFSL